MNVTQIMFTAVALAPMLVVIAIVVIWFAVQSRGKRAPMSEKLLRAPGESLRRQIDRFDERLPMHIGLLLLCGPACLLLWAVIYAFPISSHPSTASTVGVSILLLIVTSMVSWKAIQILTHQKNLFLGFRGERAVGEELNKLMLDGCFVFHDIPGEGEWNIDHAVVAPTGVFSIETKTRRKGIGAKNQRGHEVFYDGKTLQYPRCQDSHGIGQAKANAKWLGRHLSKSLGHEVKAIPILTIPGWLVVNRVKPATGDVLVLNQKQIRSAIVSGRDRMLNQKAMEQIAYQLEQRCRDVEF